jgi:Flp pilus assembly pilin Flp
MLSRRLKTKKGQGLVEYIMIVVLIAIAVFTIVKLFGTNVNTAFTNANETISELGQNSKGR